MDQLHIWTRGLWDGSGSHIDKLYGPTVQTKGLGERSHMNQLHGPVVYID